MNQSSWIEVNVFTFKLNEGEIWGGKGKFRRWKLPPPFPSIYFLLVPALFKGLSREPRSPASGSATFKLLPLALLYSSKA